VVVEPVVLAGSPEAVVLVVSPERPAARRSLRRSPERPSMLLTTSWRR